MTWTSKYCELHTYIKDGVEHVKPVQKILINGNEVCPRCQTEKWNKNLQGEVQQYYDDLLAKHKQNVLFTKSILNDKTITNASIDLYITDNQEERQNKDLCLEIMDCLKEGQVFNVLIQGNPGAGKSHLAYSILRELNQSGKVSCLFIDIDQMLRHIRSSFNYKDSHYTEGYFIKLLSSVDFLVLDDLGAETGAIETYKSATDFVQRILYAVTNARQDKVTISTTNLSSEQLFSIYDKKLVSRLLRNPKFILFKETRDKRITGLPF